GGARPRRGVGLLRKLHRALQQVTGACRVAGLAEQAMLVGGCGPQQADRRIAFARGLVHHLCEQCFGAVDMG
ncbi:hypothetical protein, partial [Stenotrophomonas maltophilia]|uniref:hypothetical protein n=1 Tax=Stenotrophomonas maltophilia TaxID=40324 RepID=UPI00313C8ED9